ncbi:Minichromosome maintenance domain-containing protein 2, partial [Geodia barretti]
NSSGALVSLREQSSQYTAARDKVVYRLCLEIDPLGLLQFNAELGDLLLHSPRQFWQLAQNICFTAATTLDWIPGLSSPSQLLLELRLSSLPTSPGSYIYTPHLPWFLPSLASCLKSRQTACLSGVSYCRVQYNKTE